MCKLFKIRINIQITFDKEKIEKNIQNIVFHQMQGSNMSACKNPEKGDSSEALCIKFHPIPFSNFGNTNLHVRTSPQCDCEADVSTTALLIH
jgi:hypothetical protein